MGKSEIIVMMKETSLSNRICIWTNDFLFLYTASDVTPYMHAFRCHVPQFLRLYSNIGNFNQQGLEKLNDQMSKGYFRASNHRGIECLRLVMLKKIGSSTLKQKVCSM